MSDLGNLDPEKETKKRDKIRSAGPRAKAQPIDDGITGDDLPKNIDAEDPEDKESYEGIDVPAEGFGEPVVTEGGVPQSDPETGIPIVDEYAAKAEHKDAVAAEKAAEKERREQEKEREKAAKQAAKEQRRSR